MMGEAYMSCLIERSEWVAWRIPKQSPAGRLLNGSIVTFPGSCFDRLCWVDVTDASGDQS